MATSFSFSTVTDVTFGAGTAKQIGRLAREHKIQRAFLVTDPGIIKLNLLDDALHSLAQQNVSVTLFADVVADPPETIVMAALAAAKQSGCDGVIGFGGGSSMDVAKLIAVLLKGQQQLSEIYGVDQISGDRTPLIQVPTTAGTGSEATMVSIITTGTTTKTGIVSRKLLADRIILDPELTLGLPAHITAATGIDAMVHAIEAFTSKRLKNPVSDMLATEALRLMSGSLERAVVDGSDLEARSNMLLGAMMAGQAFANAPVGAVHALAYPLGGLYHLPHGLSNSLVLPHVLKFNAAKAGHWYRQLAPIIMPDAALPKDDVEVTNLLAEYFLALAKKLGLPTTLKQMNIAETDLQKLAEHAMLQQRLLINNPRDVTEHDALMIYQQTF